MTLAVLMAVAYDANMNRDPRNDEWQCDDLGNFPEELLTVDWIKIRHPKAICVKRIADIPSALDKITVLQ